MITLLKNVACRGGVYRGEACCGEACRGEACKDILICAGKIAKIVDCGACDIGALGETVDCHGLCAYPGMIDQHVHITGGGGEDGFSSRVSGIDVCEILKAGVTTVCGILGADGLTKSLPDLYAKAKALDAEGMTSFVYSGSYAVPPVTFTGSMTKDMALIDKVIGAGEIAVSDHRSSQPDAPELAKLASEIHLGGLLSGKAGVLHIHVGDGKKGLLPVKRAAEDFDLPMEMFVPTHLNRNPALLEQAVEYCGEGGNIDFTAGETAGIAVPQAVKRLIDAGLSLTHVTVSSDANGSIPGGGVGKIQVLYDDVRRIVTEGILPADAAFALVTENVAKLLKLYPRKGALLEGSDADILIVDKNYHVDKLFCMGILKFDGGRIVRTKNPRG